MRRTRFRADETVVTFNVLVAIRAHEYKYLFREQKNNLSGIAVVSGR